MMASGFNLAKWHVARAVSHAVSHEAFVCDITDDTTLFIPFFISGRSGLGPLSAFSSAAGHHVGKGIGSYGRGDTRVD